MRGDLDFRQNTGLTWYFHTNQLEKVTKSTKFSLKMSFHNQDG